MKEFWTTIQLAFAAVGGWLGWFLGGCDGLLYALLAFVVIDYITVHSKDDIRVTFKDGTEIKA